MDPRKPTGQKPKQMQIALPPEQIEREKTEIMQKFDQAVEKVAEVVIDTMTQMGIPAGAYPLVLDVVRSNLEVNQYLHTSAVQTLVHKAQTGQSIVVPGQGG